jgi:murein DD-endopeptidase MepM/ murein hydrolase activator NlpD
MRRPATLIGIVVATTLASPAAAHAATPSFLFPVVGGATYVDDYGDPRGQGRHQGNDLMAQKGTPVIAVANGVVTLHHSGRGGYMLYLRNSAHEWLYIHLNNDVRGNDGQGGRKTAYASGLRTGVRVRAGQEIGYVGNSGDAEGGASHLHFEEHSRNGTPHSPYAHLRAAPIVSISAVGRRSAAKAPTFIGRMTWIAGGDNGLYVRAAIRLTSIRIDSRTVVTKKQVVVRLSPAAATAAAAIAPGSLVRVEVTPARLTLAHQLLRPGVWQAASIAAR